MLLISILGIGQTTVTIGGGSTVTCPATPTATYTTPPTGVTFSNWSRGSGVTCASASTALSGSGFNTTNAASSFSANKFFSFTITAASTHNFTLNSIVWSTAVSSGGCNFTVQYSNNGGALTTLGIAAQTSTSSNTFTAASTITVTAGTSIVIYLIPAGTGAAGTTVRLSNGSTVNVTASLAATAPTVTNTTPATNISATSATLAGNVTATGGANITGNGSVYSLTSTNAAPQIGGNGVVQLSTSNPGTGTGSFSNNISATLSPNTQYSFNAYAINSAGTSYGTVSTFYTLANVPNAPTVNNPSSSSLDVAIGSGDGNPSSTEYAIQETNSGNYVQANGTLGASAVWQTAATWGTKTVTGLAPSSSFTFNAKARNTASTETTFGSSTTNSTSAASTPVIVGAATATAFTTTYGTPSSVQTFSISGVNLINDITATAPTGFEVSSDGVTYNTTAVFNQSGGNASGSLRIRLAANASVTGSYNSQNIVLSSSPATSVNIVTSSSGNSITAATLTINGLSASNKTYDRTTSVTVSGTPTFVGLVNNESFTPSGSVTWAFADALVGSSKTLIRTGSYAAPSSNYTVTQPSLSANIEAISLTISGTPSVVSKTYDRTTSATITGISLVGVVSPDVVTFNDRTANNGKSVTLTLSGADNGNYTWNAPTGVTGNITPASLTISSPAVTNKLFDGTTSASITGTLT
ncbi:MAG: beta strand repeat-containing protein, partial [Dolichospermum sp.]